LVFIIGEDVVHFRMVVFAGHRILDESEERLEVWRRCWGVVFGGRLVGSCVPGGEAGC
jgi:hypothetical protein